MIKASINKSQKIFSLLKSFPWLEIFAKILAYLQNAFPWMFNRGIYEVLELEINLDIRDTKGKNATYNKRQLVKYLQNNVIAYHDQAWGDGKILLDFECSPGVAVDQYRSGHKILNLISLRKIRNWGEQDELRIRWKMKNSFLRKKEEWITSISHPTKQLKINIEFPKNRPPRKISIVEINRNREKELESKALRQLPNGRWLVSWRKTNLRLYENYAIQWIW